jgi:tripartite-type tricarboxylate transporter receptor subunit TctC
VPEIRERVLATGMEPLTNSPQEFAAMIRDESAKWAKVIKIANVKLN